MIGSLTSLPLARFRFICATCAIAFAFVFGCAPSTTGQNAANNSVPVASNTAAQAKSDRTPSDTVRDFYKALRERHFKEAYSMTIYKEAFDSLSADELEDLRPNFEEQARQVPESVDLSGEQISGNIASVFVRVPATSADSPQVTSKPVTLIKSDGAWIIGTEADRDVVKKAGKRFFLDNLIAGNEEAIEDLMKKLVSIQFVYAQQHNGQYGDLAALIGAGLLGTDLSTTESTGYRFHIVATKDGKGYVAGAEPARYGRTAKLSFSMDETGKINKADSGGKPLGAPAAATPK